MHLSSQPATGDSTHWTNQDGAGDPLTGRPLSALPPFRLVDDFEAGYIKFNGREPRTLQELAIARAEYDHRRRIAEVKAMAKKLELLEQFLPALAARGIKLAYRKFATWDGGKTLRIESQASTSGDNKLHAALIELGFREIERKPLYRNEHTVKLQHGRWLVVSFIVTEPQAPAQEGGAS